MSAGKPTTQNQKQQKPKKDLTGLGTMLIALGGALRGDENFSARALQIKQIADNNKRIKEQEKAWETWKENNLDIYPESFKNLANLLSAEQGIDLAIKFSQPPKPKTQSEYAADILNKIRTIPNYQLTPEDELVLQVLRKADPQTRTIEDISAEAIRLQGMQKNKIPDITGLSAEEQRKIYDNLKDGDKFTRDGIEYIKGQ